MKIGGYLATAIVCVTMSINAKAEELITPTLWAEGGRPDSPSAFLACNLTNVSSTTRTVRTRIVSNGVILLDSGNEQLDPWFTANHFVEGLSGGGPIYCHFTVQGYKTWYRGAAKLFRFDPDDPTAVDTTDFLVISAE